MALVLTLSFVFPMYALADYPSKPITIIVPSKAGGSTDTSARIFAKVAKKYWKGADFVIQNIPGSGGQKGFEAIARAKTDGHTIGMVFTTQLVSHIVSKRARYTLDSFHIMGNAMDDPLIIAVPKESEIKDLQGFMKKAKAQSLTVAVNGIGSDDFVAAKKFENALGAAFNLLPTKGSTEQKALILGNHCDASIMNLSQIQAQHKAGTARAIALLADERSAVLLDVKTAKEQGLDVQMTATRGFVAPAGIDKNILAKLDDLLMKVNNDAEFMADCDKNVYSRLPMTGHAYLGYLMTLQAETQSFYDQNPW